MKDEQDNLRHIAVWVCQPCLDGKGGVCNSPGCVFIRQQAPTIDRREIEAVSDLLEAAKAEAGKLEIQSIDDFIDRLGDDYGEFQCLDDIEKHIAERKKQLTNLTKQQEE